MVNNKYKNINCEYFVLGFKIRGLDKGLCIADLALKFKSSLLRHKHCLDKNCQVKRKLQFFSKISAKISVIIANIS